MIKAKITLKNVAEACGLSASIVSRVLQYDDSRYSKDTRELVKRTAAEMNYRPNQLARGIRTGKTGIVGFLVCSMTGQFQDADFPADIIKAINLDVFEHNYQVLFTLVTPENMASRQVPPMIRDSYVEGAIAYGFHAALDYAKLLTEYQRPVILLEAESDEIPCVVHDDERLGALAAEHLWRKGVRRPAIVTVDDHSPIHERRCKGFLDRLAMLSGHSNSAAVILNEEPWNDEAGVCAARKLLAQQEPPDGVMAINDFFAGHIAACFRQHGNDAEVVGIGVAAPQNDPRLTILQCDRFGAGKRAVKVLFDAIDGKELQHKQVISVPASTFADAGDVQAEVIG